MGVVSGGDDQGVRNVTLIDVSADADLARISTGLAAHADLLTVFGGEPNDLAGTLQGVNNDAAPARAIRLYQAYVEQALGQAGSLRGGFFDINGEFDVADSAALLMAPPYGIGGEFSATGAAGPSTYPSSALGLRLRLNPTPDTYAQAAVVNALAGVPGDRGGADLSFREGVVAMAEVGWTGRGKIALGAWTYSRRRDDIRDLDLAGDPVRRRPQGAYVIVEAPVRETVALFAKLGVSDGRTTDTAASWQAGALVAPAFRSRPQSSFSVGVAQARLAGRARANLADVGVRTRATETQFEVTYSDRLGPHIALQPDLQVIDRPYGRVDTPTAVVAALRLVADF